MTEGSLAIAAYGLSLLSDPCVIVSAGVAGVVGGRALAWGIAFGLIHFSFGIIGLSLSSHFLKDSEITAHVIALILIALFFAHTARHAESHDCCGCEGDTRKSWSKGSLLLGALSGVAFHATGVGLVLQVAGSPLQYNALITTLAFGSIFLGCFVGLIVNQHDALAREAKRAVKWMPGLVTAVLILLFSHLTLEIFTHVEPSLEFNMQYIYAGAFAIAIITGFLVQKKSGTHHQH